MQLTKLSGGCRFKCASKLAIQRSQVKIVYSVRRFLVHWLHYSWPHNLCTIHAHKSFAILFNILGLIGKVRLHGSCISKLNKGNHQDKTNTKPLFLFYSVSVNVIDFSGDSLYTLWSVFLTIIKFQHLTLLMGSSIFKFTYINFLLSNNSHRIVR